MQILALDTASPFPSVTLLVREELREESFSQDRRASEELLPAIERCLAAGGTTLARCDRIAVCSGPGSFTGLRIGLATAWALGRAAGVPVETVSTLEALAETARGGPSRVAAVLDAGRGDVVLAVYSLAEARARLEGEPERLPREEGRQRTASLETVASPRDLLGAGAASAPRISASRALALAVARAPREASASLAGIYSRPSAAEEKLGTP
jgi:tRNA threonylcarbamoyladenosine biosynthesis protein TsaB